MPLGERGRISENEMPRIRIEIQKGGAYNKYGGSARRIEIGPIEKHGPFEGMPFFEIPDGAHN